MKNMPKNHKTLNDSYITVFPEGVDRFVFGQFSLQGKNLELEGVDLKSVQEVFKGKYGPSHIDIAWHTQSNNYTNILFLVYWLHVEDYIQWKDSPIVKKWIEEDGYKQCSSRVTGFWYEMLKIPVEYFESSHSGNSGKEGVSNFLKMQLSEVHEYWGAMRDRIPASAYDQLLSQEINKQKKIYGDETSSKKLSITVPDYICFIRTVQNLSNVSEEERQIYAEVMEPVLDTGIKFLSDILDSCIDIKKVTEMSPNKDELQITSVLAYFKSLSALEKWAASHPTHLSIYGTYFKILKMQEGKSDISLWHEVSVLKSEDVETYYCYCQPDTGLLSSFTHKKL